MTRVRWGAALLLALAAASSEGCALFFPAKRREFVNQNDVLDAVARTSGYRPDSSFYRLRHADVFSDLITYHYQGVKHPGDRAWVICFSQKSSEQRPEELIRLDNLLAAVSPDKEGFRVVEKGRRAVKDLEVEFARYRFRSLLRDSQGRQVEAGGAAAVTAILKEPAPVIYRLNVENIEGDRPDLGFPELMPLLEAIKD